MRERGFEIHIATSPGSVLYDFARTEGAISHLVPMTRAITPLQDAIALFRLWRLIRRLHPDAVQTHTPKAGLLGIVAARLVGVSVRVYEVHGLRLETTSGLKRCILWVAEWIACSLATHVIAVSPSVREEAARMKLCRPEKSRVLANGSANGVDARLRFNPKLIPPQTRRAVRSTIGIPEDALVVGFVGRLVRDKGIPELAAAWNDLHRRHARAWLVLVGRFETGDPVPTPVRAALEHAPRVVFCPYTDDIVPLYTTMDVVVLPTHREGFPNVALECAALELPIVTTDVTGARDAVIDGVTGTLVSPRCPHALSRAVSAYLNDAQLRSRHGAAARSRVLLDFSRETVWHAVVDFYRVLTGDP